MNYRLLASVAAFALLASPVLAETTVLAPGVEIRQGEEGAVVNVPGVHIDTRGMGGEAETVRVETPRPHHHHEASSSGASYRNAKLAGMDFSRKNLAGADFANATLEGARFAGSNLDHAIFSNATLTQADFSGAVLTGADLANADLSGANLTGADFSGANLANATLDGALVANANFNGANLANVDMSAVVRSASAAVAPAVVVDQRPAFVAAPRIAAALQAPQRKIDLTINFDFNSDKLGGEGSRQVQEIAAALKSAELAQARIMIEGHTDNVGSDGYNKDLSYRRALRVMRTLIEANGIPASRLSAEGFGESRPVATNDTDLGRAMNRRVTLVNMGE